jgi:hypothetical protein
MLGAEMTEHLGYEPNTEPSESVRSFVYE